MNYRNVIGCLLFSAALATAHADPQRFVIDAQYRGMMSRTFPGIGSATITAESAGNGIMSLSADGQATHPQDRAKTYRSTIDMKVNLAGGRVAVLSASQKCGPGSEQFTARIKDVMPILAVVRSTPTLTSLQTPQGAVTLKSAQAAGATEVTAERGGTLVAKIWVRGGQVDRFRVPSGEDNVVLNFNAATSTAAVLD